MRNETLKQIAIRLPAETLSQADAIAQAQKDALTAQGRTWAAGRISRSTILRDALERGLLALASTLPPKPQKPRRPKK
jgi:hypothetical protein